MSRIGRVVVPGVPHHITQRGNRGDDVFFSDGDRQQYLIWLREYAELHGLRVWAYCLMTNHVHLVAVPEREDSLARVLRPVQMRHAQRVNSDQERKGHVWHSRYSSCVLDDAHLYEAVRYVERNPVRAGMVDRAADYDWSSAPTHCGVRTDPVLSDDLPLLDTVENWADWLVEPADDAALARLRKRTNNGLPCGSDAFVKRVEEHVGLSLVDRPRGRPRKQRVEEAVP